METKTTTTTAETTMTAWEKEWMSTAPQDCMRTFVLNAAAPGGYSEYGETMCDLHTFDTLTEENGQAKVSLLKQDAPAPLPYGTFVRMYLFGEINDGVPVWQYEKNGEPKNFRNYIVTESNARWFERHPTGHIDRWKHDYSFEEVIACLKDYPIRSIKTFAEGAYTFGECLDIAFKLAFRPRSVGKYAYSIKPFTDLNEKNSKLVYSNSTLYDVVTDIGRIIDATPSMDVVFENGVYTFELRFIDRYGLEGEVHDISFFDMQLNDATNMERGSSAGSCISFAENLITGYARYPHTDGIMPADTNLSRSWEYFELPYPVESVDEVDVYWEHEIKRDEKGNTIVHLYTGEEYLTRGEFGNIMFRNPIAITRKGYSEELYNTADHFPSYEFKKTLFLREYDEYKLLLDVDSSTEPTRRNTVYYKRGDNKIYLNALFDKTYRYWGYDKYPNVVQIGLPFYASFSSDPGGVGKDSKFCVAVKFKVMINGAIRGANSKPSDYTAFFNQQGQVIDIQSFGSAVNNYTKSMLGENRIVSHFYTNIGRKEMYEDMPRVGSSVIDKERGKRYVVTDLSFIRKMNGGLLCATLSESRAGKSRFLIAGNRQKCYAIPNNSIVDSMSHTHILCKMGVLRPFEGENSTDIEKPYLFDALYGLPHAFTTPPDNASLMFFTKTGGVSRNVDVFFSRMRLSVLMSCRMRSNTVAYIEGGDAKLYTDSNGQFQSVLCTYKAGDKRVAQIYQIIEKDAYEIFNHTTQVSWVEYGNLQIGESLIDMSFFGKVDPMSAPLRLVLLSSRMHLSDDLAEHMAASYDVSIAEDDGAFTFTPRGMETPPQHVGWALVRGDKVILLDNFDQVTDKVKVFYNIEVRD